MDQIDSRQSVQTADFFSEPISECKILSQSLKEVDINLISRYFSATSKLEVKDQYKQLSLLCRDNGCIHPQWLLLSGQIEMKSLKREIPKKFSESTQALHCIFDEEYYKFVMKNAEELDNIIVDERDYRFNIFAVETLVKSYLSRIKKESSSTILETPQYMYLRVATFLWFTEQRNSFDLDIEKIKEVYDDLSLGRYSMASPTMFNAGHIRSQLASCFTIVIGDNMQSIAKSWHDMAIISMCCGGIGFDLSSLRHSEIGHHGNTNGIIPWAKIINQILITVDQGSKRKGSGTAYLCDWHIDVIEFLELRRASGPEDMRARDLFYSLWVSDEFMRRVDNNEEWTLFCPNKVQGLDNKWGIDFEIAYRNFEKKAREGKIKHFRIVNARELFFQVLLSQIEMGMPFIHYKDAINRKSNQKNLGTIRLSNLCGEITLVTDKNNIGSCNLGSIVLNFCVKYINGRPYFDFKELELSVRKMVRNINQMIDRTYYPPDIPEIKYTNLRNRPLGIGVQGLADVFALMDLSWLDQEAKDLNEMIFETMYYAAVSESIEMAKEYGHYETFKGSPASQGLFQFDLWDKEKMEKEFENNKKEEEFDIELFIKDNEKRKEGPFTNRYDWESLRKDMVKYGLRNSLLIALMPTASSANILGNNECLTGDSLVSLSNGLARRIDEFQGGESVYGVSEKGFSEDKCIKFIPQGTKDTVKLTFSDGREITCTPNHKFLLKSGEWKEAQNIILKKDEIELGVDPVIDTVDFDTWEWCEVIWDREKALALARIIGYVHADGTVWKNNGNSFCAEAIFGNLFDVNSMIEDLNILEEEYNLFEQSNGTYRLRFRNNFSKIISKTIGYGKRVDRPFNLPSFFFDENTPLSIIREYIAGHFGGDGHKPHLAGNSLRGVQLSHSIRKDLGESMKKSLNKIGEVLKKIGVTGKYRINTRKPSISKNSFSTRTDTITYILYLEANSSFSSVVGFRYCIDKSIKLSIASSYWRMVEKSMAQRDEVIKEAFNIREQCRLSCEKSLCKAREIVFKNSEPLCDYSTGNSSCFKYKRTERRETIGISPKEYLEKFEAWNSKYSVDRESAVAPTFSLQIISIKENGKVPVYDISVKETHAFFANGIAVHNCFEPYTQHIYTRTVLAGQYVIINKHLVKDLQEINMWKTDIVRNIWSNNGSIANIPEDDLDEMRKNRLKRLKEKYLTVFEIPQKELLEMSLRRGRYVCQTQSFNCWMESPTVSKLAAYHFYGWRRGAKTGMYYLRQSSGVSPINFSLDSINIPTKKQKKYICNDEICVACSS